jgi:PleD family two-component response regulator
MRDVQQQHTIARCDAILVAEDKTAATLLERIAAGAGFRAIESVFNPGARPATPAKVKFFLVHYQMGDLAKAALLKSVRSSRDDDLRFSPVVLIIDDCSFEDVLKYIDMGFDDVISLPEKAEVLHGRLSSQINASVVYIQTTSYLGPDRRRMELELRSDHQRQGEFKHSRLTIRRDTALGTKVVGETIFA